MWVCGFVPMLVRIYNILYWGKKECYKVLIGRLFTLLHNTGFKWPDIKAEPSHTQHTQASLWEKTWVTAAETHQVLFAVFKSEGFTACSPASLASRRAVLISSLQRSWLSLCFFRFWSLFTCPSSLSSKCGVAQS